MKRKLQGKMRLYKICAAFDVIVISVQIALYVTGRLSVWWAVPITILFTWMLLGDLGNWYSVRKIMRDPLFYLMCVQHDLGSIRAGDRVQTGPVTVIRGEVE